MKNKLLTALISFVVALGLWFYVVTVVSPNSDKVFTNIPVMLQSEVLLQERGLMIIGMDTDNVTLHLEGSRIDLNKLSSSNITVTLDVSKIYEPGSHQLTYSHTFPGDVASNAINVLSKTPGTITVEVQERISKEVPVEVVYNGSLAGDLIADKENKELSAETVTVTGPKSVIDQIHVAQIQVDLEGRSESFSEVFPYTLCNERKEPVDAKMVTTNAESLTLTLKIMRLKELPVEVEIIYGGGATQENTAITVEPQTIWVSGSDSVLAGLDKLVLGTVNLAELENDETLIFPINLPEGVTNESDVTVTEAKVDVKFEDLYTNAITLKTGFQVINVPAGMKAELLTKALEVQIRSTEDQLANVKPEDFQVIVDLKDAQPGTAKLKADIQCANQKVGAVGTYTVSVTLSKT